MATLLGIIATAITVLVLTNRYWRKRLIGLEDTYKKELKKLAEERSNLAKVNRWNQRSMSRHWDW